MKKEGFTIIEMLVVVFIILSLFVSSIYISNNFYQKRTLENFTNELRSNIEQSRSYAIYKNNDNYGVKIIGSQYFIFKGASYQNRDTNFPLEIYDVPSNIIIQSTISEIDFQQRTGNLINYSLVEFFVNLENKAMKIQVNNLGFITIINLS